jgi:hypothetical protein
MVSQRQVTHTAPPTAVKTSCSPVTLRPTCSKMHIDPSHGPQTAVCSIPPRFCEESPCHRLDGTELRQSDEAYCSSKEIVSNQRVVPMALPPASPTRYLPCSPQPTHSKTRCKPSYGPQTTVRSIPPRFRKESCSCHLDNAGSCQNYEQCCSGKKIVNEREVAHPAPPPVVPTRYSPRSQQPTRSKTRIELPYGPKKTVSSIHSRFCQQSRNENFYGPSVAVSSIHPRIREESHCRPHLGVELDQGNDTCCSASKMVNDRRVTRMAPAPKVQTRDLPRSPRTTHSKVRVETLHGPPAAVLSETTPGERHIEVARSNTSLVRQGGQSEALEK